MTPPRESGRGAPCNVLSQMLNDALAPRRKRGKSRKRRASLEPIPQRIVVINQGSSPRTEGR